MFDLKAAPKAPTAAVTLANLAAVATRLDDSCLIAPPALKFAFAKGLLAF